MGKRKTQKLTGLETLVMNAIWALSEATVKDVQSRLEAEKPLAYNTVLTLMRRLRDKGFLESERDGRADVYRPLVARENAAQKSLSDLLDRFFGGSAEALVSQLAQSTSRKELRSIREAVDEAIEQQERKSK